MWTTSRRHKQRGLYLDTFHFCISSFDHGWQGWEWNLLVIELHPASLLRCVCWTRCTFRILFLCTGASYHPPASTCGGIGSISSLLYVLVLGGMTLDGGGYNKTTQRITMVNTASVQDVSGKSTYFNFQLFLSWVNASFPILNCWCIQLQLPPAYDCPASTHHVNPAATLIRLPLAEWQVNAVSTAFLSLYYITCVP
ncbi:predicted protein [Lichtheimia corymbifera JMRC:FSU:9682]|uniref:Uncharacterized protein n=1 Tax=Lichtheimia corymbifera JMRC:FSU:9682 TaxID=1263082 RepID=A0A068S2Q8_9FUNG|nr:predicted protein [Lichtheimia corymbifera JMRC:FSU:9682]